MIDSTVRPAFDLIGDLHGHHQALLALLERLGYVSVDGIHQHPAGRKLIFIGDLVDRGPKVRETVRLVRALVESGQALCVLGNHEYNLLCYCSWIPNGEAGAFLRGHDAKNSRQVAATLAAFGDDPGELLEVLDWFRSLPLYLDLPGLRAVHACWDQVAVDFIRQQLPHARLTPSFLYKSSLPGSPEFVAIEALLKGWQAPLPEGFSYADAEGHVRTETRLRWWPGQGEFWSDWMLTDAGLGGSDSLAFDRALLPGALYPADAPPVFCGHYWLRGTPGLQTPNVACLDYSIAKGGTLVAYRWDGEQVLEQAHFVSV